ncbi:MAG TPA: 2-C-methyl-D-erythritol 2,4-cyclodiphosphate synthase [Gammaproteobacteria bacterium]|nr:2-C-methyl-D-erythritol 2,4-cyclodiphosphate synthase [Gammaproteobacteria bacterium]|tara:strand:- start:33 stop:518 length:486 start_codon:yes stop_codon:yes gene_type:complete
MFRVGQGYDVHRLEPGRDLWIGGVQIPFPKGLSGHSDADVLLHAICDALLGAAAAGDIGFHFPDSDSAHKGRKSREFLQRVRDVVLTSGWLIGNIDATVVAEKPKLMPYIDEMRSNVAAILQIELSQVSIKATTTEGLGLTGRGEGIAALAVAMLTSEPFG